MPRTFNYTGRRKILREQVTIRIVEKDGMLGFTADLRLQNHDFPADAHVYVEAYRGISAQWKRFDFGRVGLIDSKEHRPLDEFGRSEGILFRVKVTASGERQGRLLGEADGIRPERSDDSKAPVSGLIEIASKDLGGEPWRLEFPDTGAGVPVLCLNERLEHWQSLAREPEFREWTAASAMRQILTWILIIDADVGEEDDEESSANPTDWRQKWLKFAESLPDVEEHPEPLKTGEDIADRNDLTEWIDRAVSGFGKKQGLMESLAARKNQETPS
jgi:hypothetical protein